ncbi:MAG: ribulose-phosphate 3-epimerase [Actinobacteria bacterium]|nr:ribulose-phosphate 3-epimerase [Actinomycetota bacterium]
MTREIRITPSILNADFDHLDQEIGKIAGVSDLIHLDIMDNIFVPNFTFDFESASTIIKGCPIGVDAHLMVANVDEIAPKYAQVGCASVTIHAEASENIAQTLRTIRSEGSRSGLAIKPNSSIEEYERFSDLVDMFLIMTVEPGFGGQKFMSEMMDKVRATRKVIGNRPIWLQVDGGISLETIEIAVEAGADTFVAGSAVFKSDDPAHMINALRSLAKSASS